MITFLDSDDILPRNALEIRSVSGGFKYTDMAFFNNKGKLLGVRKANRIKCSRTNDYLRNSINNHLTMSFTPKFLQYLTNYVMTKYKQNCIFPKFPYGEDLDMHYRQ